MTIPAKTAWGNAVGTGITGPYSVPFPLYDQSNLTVLQVNNSTPTAPVITTMVLGTDYTFSAWSPDNKGQVAVPQITFTTAVASGIIIIMLLTLPGTQPTAITNYADFFPQIHEMTFDQLVQYVNQLNQKVGKTLVAPDWEFAGQTILTLPPIALRALKVLAFDANGNTTTLDQVPSGSVTFSNFGKTLVNLASLTALLNLLGLWVVANAAGLSGVTPVSNGLNIAYQQDTGDVWIYNAIDNGTGSAGWAKLAQITP